MSNISKVTRSNGLAKTGDDVIECISIGGILIDLRNVSPELRRAYHSASKRVGNHEAARAHLNAVGQAILAEQAPNLATKAFATAHKQSRVSGDHAVASRLMKCASSK
jgi:hypothetical protein